MQSARSRIVVLLLAATAHVAVLAAPYAKPGKAWDTPVRDGMIDADAFREWQSGEEAVPAGRGSERGPGWILWTVDGPGVGHSGLTFGERKEPGPRHVRVGLREEIPVGSVVVRGNVGVSVLRGGAGYPGDMGDDGAWTAGQRLVAGSISTLEPGRDEVSVWVFPSGTATRALRFTHTADPADPKYEGWLGGAMVSTDRLLDMAPMSLALSGSNNRHAPKVVNGETGGWKCWENTGTDEAELANRPLISEEHAEWVQLTWPQTVALDGLATVWTGFGAMEVQSYVGPATQHPRDASDDDWRAVASFAGFESGYPSQFWPNAFPFGETINTRAIRLRMTAVTPVHHSHVKNKPAGGKRVWLGEVLAMQKLGDKPFVAPHLEETAVEVPHPPIAVPFELPEAGYATLVIEDETGRRVRNLVSETWFPAGKNTAWWDGTDDLGRDLDAANHGLYSIPARFVEPGRFTARGLWRKEIEPFFEFAVYSAGEPPWNTPDHTGAWLANHSPPQAAVFVPETHSPTGEPAVFLGCYVTEGPDGMAWVDLDGRKRGGMKWIGGNWTAAPFLCRDMAPDADPKTSAYVASVWETGKKSGIYELRVTALDRTAQNELRSRAVYKGVLEVGKGERRPELGGIACFAGKIICTLPGENRLLQVDGATGTVVAEMNVADPRGVAYDGSGRLFVLSGKQLLRVAATAAAPSSAARVTVVASGLEDPFGVALCVDGSICVSDHGTSHQVKVFSPDGKLLRAIGHAGTPKAGPYDPLHMNHPAGIAADSQDQLWVTEHDYMPKRVSVWSLDGTFVRAFYGPGKYGGGGVLDKHHRNRFYYADESKGTLEFRLDWQKGTSELVAVLCRNTTDSMEMPFRTAAPETALYHGGRRYFTNCYNTNPTQGHNTAFLHIDRGGVAYPVAGMGMANEWDLLKTEPFLTLWPKDADPQGNKWANEGRNQALFMWTDRNGDAHAQPDEVRLHHCGARGVTVMEDLSFCIANSSGRAMRFFPTSFSADGVPVYDYTQGKILAEGVDGPKSSGGCQMLADDSDEAVITLGVEPFHSHSVSGVQAGKAAWSYPSLWPGLHASHHAAKPDRPGQLIGTTRLLGGFVEPKGSEVGPLWAVNGNMGNFYLMTRDGLFVATVFEDVRQGKLWKMAVAQRNMSLKGISLHDENFWPSISQTPEGQVYAVDGANCSLVRLDGLETLRRIEPIRVDVTPKDLEASRQFVIDREAVRQRAMGRGVLAAAIRPIAPKVDGELADWRDAGWVEIDRRGDGANFNSNAKPYNILGTMAVSGDRFYAAWNSRDGKLLQNSGELPNALFKTGGALDVQIGCDPSANPDRRSPVAGDLRLLVTQVGKDTKAVLYRQVAPQANAGDKVPFSSPWRTVSFDQVLDVSDQVVLGANGKGDYEISIPLAVLGLKPTPGMRLKGDIGILRGNGTETTARSYWSNKATGITADVPSEVMLTPYLWGTVEWE